MTEQAAIEKNELSESIADALRAQVEAHEDDAPEAETHEAAPDAEPAGVEETETHAEAPQAAPEAPAAEEPVKSEITARDPSTEWPQGQRPPLRWSEDGKKKWGEIPEDLRKEILGRERHIEMVMERTADARRTHEAMGQIAQRYAPLMAAEGVQDPIQAFQGLMDVTAQLRLGTPVEKAQRVAGLIQHYGVDLQTLDRILAGQQPSQEVSQQDQIQQAVKQQVGPIQQQLQAQQQREREQLMTQINQEHAEFAKTHEFFEELQPVMADLFDLAARRGENLTLEAAYERAMAASPQVQAKLTERAQAKQAAASSLSAPRRGSDAPATNGAGDSPEDTLRFVIDAQGRGL